MINGLLIILSLISVFLCSCNEKYDKESDSENNDNNSIYYPECGNTILDEGEKCDSTLANCTFLDSEKYRAGFAKCKEDCSGYDVSKCLQNYSCGNKIVEPGEICDGNFKSCSEIDPERYTMGFAPCYKYCNGWDASKCKNFHECGNGFVESVEICEIGDKIKCSSLYPSLFTYGDAQCNEHCSGWDFSDCALLQCLEYECGTISVSVDGIMYEYNCGNCYGGDICNSFNKCEYPCAESKCGKVDILDSRNSIVSVECRECKGLQYCGEDNQCKPACSDMACGIDNGVNCGNCPVGYYCGSYPNRCKKMPEIEFVEIPGGTFFMGCNSFLDDSCNEAEKPGHLVELRSYMIGKHEVTAEQYLYCIDSGICNLNVKEVQHYKTYKNSFKCNIESPREPQQPANCINYFGAEAFCKFIGGRLPTEAEWEKAARGGCEFYENCEKETRIYPWGNDLATCDTAVITDVLTGISGCETGGTMPVGSKPYGKSLYGTYDMSGNVWEWCSDWFDAGYFSYSPENDPQGPEIGREKVLKGGSCNFHSKAVRPSYRYNVYPNLNYSYGGFRCVKEITD